MVTLRAVGTIQTSKQPFGFIMDQPPKARIGWLLMGIFVAPIVLHTANIMLGNWLFPRGEGNNYELPYFVRWLWFHSSIGVGILSIMRCPLPLALRVYLSMPYAYLAYWLLMFYTVAFVCKFYGDCI